MGTRGFEGAMEGLGRGLAEVGKYAVLDTLSKRHEEAILKVKHKYRQQEIQQAGIIEGQAAAAKTKADTEAAKVKREHEMSKLEREEEGKLKREHLKGYYDIEAKKIGATGKSRRFTSTDGHTYTAKQVIDFYKAAYPDVELLGASSGAPSIAEYAEKVLKIPDYPQDPGATGLIASETAGEKPEVEQEETERGKWMHLWKRATQ